MSVNSRRKFLAQAAGAAGLGIFYSACTSQKQTSANSPGSAASFFEISLAEWSLHKALFAKK